MSERVKFIVGDRFVDPNGKDLGPVKPEKASKADDKKADEDTKKEG